MKTTHHLILVMITISSLILSAQGLSSYTYTFNNLIASPIKLPAYPLGYLAGNETIDWKIETWVNTVELSSMTVKLLYAVNLTQVGTLLKTCSATINCSGLFLTPSAGEYYLKLEQASASFNFMSPFYLVVDSYPGNKTFVGNPLARQLLRIGDVLRANNVGKLIYSSQAQKITLSLYPLPANTSSYAFMQILPIDMGTYAYSFMDMANYPSNYVSY